jgi:hypothetical protein
MKQTITIQNSRDGRYLSEPGFWAEPPERARQFKSSTDAVIYCLEQKVPDAQIRFSFDNPKFDFVVAITVEKRSGNAPPPSQP